MKSSQNQSTCKGDEFSRTVSLLFAIMRSSPTVDELLRRLHNAGINTLNDLLLLPAIKQNPFYIKVLKRFAGKNKDISVAVKSLYTFLSTDKLKTKLFYVFQVYDSDMDGLISRMELFDTLRFLSDGNLESWKIQNVVDLTFSKAGFNKDTIDFECFMEIVCKNTNNLMRVFKCNEM